MLIRPSPGKRGGRDKCPRGRPQKRQNVLQGRTDGSVEPEANGPDVNNPRGLW
jgi:hypothetical protein